MRMIQRSGEAVVRGEPCVFSREQGRTLRALVVVARGTADGASVGVRSARQAMVVEASAIEV
jgi:hypothetical protein